MSDQEPDSKRMIDQLWEYTEPFQPGAWQHFERFRDNRNRKRRVLIFWMNVAALLIVFGTAILINQLIPRGKTTKGILAKTQIESTRLSGKQNPENLPRIKTAIIAAPSPDLVKLKIRDRIITKTHSPKTYQEESVAAMQDSQPANKLLILDQIQKQELLSLDFLQSLPLRFQSVHFGKLHIPLRQQHSKSAIHLTRSIRFGVAVSQQSNRAANTHLEMNYGVGGALYIPVTQKITFVTGTSGSKQSLNVEKNAAASTPLGGFAQLQRAHYQWFNVEVPMHLQYSLKNFKKTAITAVGGLSWMGSVGQVSDYFYKTSRKITTVSETAGGPVVVSTQTVEDFSSVRENDKRGNWTFGGALYLGIGLNYQMQDYGLGIEPYVKYPIGPVTAENLQLTSLGIQLKLTGLLGKPR
ncbi:hypothetical protein L0663_01080 [Dyadobacter sp. CY107]|uniref:hypothetical protein n=1 Tax=Dyadobacter fanqingshengii TaxID=2906443 RepID=UPI001F38446D|nr:hypothetical protein [Dyadobacter fanqingshengii]MCF2501956.1 hypothetical protein [Dyadobacter fanqingshengii]